MSESKGKLCEAAERMTKVIASLAENLRGFGQAMALIAYKFNGARPKQ